MKSLAADKTIASVSAFWDAQIVPTLKEYIAIPNKSPSFDPKWVENGHMERVLQLALAWLEKHPLPGMKIQVGRLEGRTPALLVEVPGQVDRTVLLYGHLDKQPEMEGWREGLGPWKPVMEGEKLYGRGGADDGYALFASVAALRALQEQGVAHGRCVILIEFCEESGSPDLPFYVDHFAETIGQVDLVVCLDSGAGNYEQMWVTTSLRGMVSGSLTASVLTEGVHSGNGSGIVASSFRVLREALERVESTATGEVKLKEFHVTIPEARLAQAKAAAKALGDEVYSSFPLVPGIRTMQSDNAELILNRTWRPTLSVVGVDGIPPVSSAGAVLRPYTRLKLSFRLPPTADAHAATAAVTAEFAKPALDGAKLEWKPDGAANGWNAPDLAPWLAQSLEAASQTYYQKPALYMGEGGTIPFMGMLGAKFPKAQFVVTGVLGPQSNAHGPNEFLHVGYAKRLTACISHVVADHARVHAK